MTWTPEQINDVLAIAGVRTPGKIPAEPERVIAVLLLDERVLTAALRDETRRVLARAERAYERCDALESVVTERDELLLRIDGLHAATIAAEQRAKDAEAVKVTAFAMVRDLEVRLREGRST